MPAPDTAAKAPSPRSGVLAAGNFIIDHVKRIEAYPEPETLTTILDASESNGGGPYNLLKDLTRLRADFPLQALGLIGRDPAGDRILADLSAHGIDTTRLRRTGAAATSYTDAMTDVRTGQRTFFHHRGSNALLNETHFTFDGKADIFYLGYLLLLDALDTLDGGTTAAAQVMSAAREGGYRTCVDIVSTPHPEFGAIVRATLPHVDLLFINEFEAASVLGGGGDPPREPSELIPSGKALLELGVGTAVCLHMATGAVLVPARGQPVLQPAVALPQEEIAGATGAGDAFAAGFVHEWHHHRPWEECLRLGVCAAAASLRAATPSEGVPPRAEALALGDRYGFRTARAG